MRPNLSFENLATVLAALGTSALVACASSTPQPVQVHEVTPTAKTPAANASCSASGCGATTTATATPPGSPPPAAAIPAPPPTDAASATTPIVAPAPAPTTTTAATVTPAPKKAAPRGTTAQVPKKKPAADAEASCGAGTCAGSPKQKLL